MIVIGLTGSIGMGKSTLAQMLRDFSIPVHESDRAVHELLNKDGKGFQAIKALFPPMDYPQIYDTDDGEINRSALGELVFRDDALRVKLEGALHPLVQVDQQEFITAQEAAGKNMVVLDIPLLFETGAEARVDCVIVVSAPQDVQRARVLARPNMSEEKFQNILSLQMPDAQKRKRADYIIETGGSFEETRSFLEAVLNKLRKP